MFILLLAIEEEPDPQKTLEMSESKGEFITIHVMYCLVLSCI